MISEPKGRGGKRDCSGWYLHRTIQRTRKKRPTAKKSYDETVVPVKGVIETNGTSSGGKKKNRDELDTREGVPSLPSAIQGMICWGDLSAYKKTLCG